MTARAATLSAMQEERDALRARLRGDGTPESGTHGVFGFVSVTEMREVEAETQSLRMQLVEVLRDRELRDQQQEALEGDLLKAISQLQLAADQRSLLYRDLARVRAERDADVSTLKEAKRVVDEKLATLEIELKETKKAMEVLVPLAKDYPMKEEWERCEREIKTRTRNLVRAEVQVVRLTRQITLLEASEVTANRRARQAEREVRAMGRVLRARLDQVTRSRDEAFRRLVSLQNELDAAAPRTVLVHTQNQVARLERRLRVSYPNPNSLS